jgi:XapX domain-containing protein
MMNIGTLILSFVTGGIVGVIFSAVKLPVPAPLVLEGVAGVAGITIGYMVVEIVRRRLGG